MHNSFFMTSLSLTSLNVVGSLHKVYNTPLANVLLGSIYFDKTVQTKKFSLCHFFYYKLDIENLLVCKGF